MGRFAAHEVAFFSKPSKQGWYHFLKSLGDTGRPTDELLGNILGLAVGASANYAQAAVHVVDFYLDDARAKERAEIVKLVDVGDEKSTELLRGYVREAMRMFLQVLFLIVTSFSFWGIFRLETAGDGSLARGGCRLCGGTGARTSSS